jgi:hypothetical protein
VKRPANVDGELLRLPSRQEHAEVQCVQKSLFTDPPSLFDQLGVHDGDLASRSAETDKSQLEPETERFDKRWLLHHDRIEAILLQFVCVLSRHGRRSVSHHGKNR